VTIGSHSVHHHRLGALEAQASRTEIHDSKARLEELLGQPVAHFCYPYGHYDRAVREAVCEAGYLTGLTTIRGRADQAANAYEIPRQGISYKDTRLHYAYKLHLKHADRFKNASR
jgi:peptidoglycan/xylan/chitin deacetylase (PgdA/CDA1 family)